MIDLSILVQQKIDFLDRQIAETKIMRDQAPAPTESASDKTRQIAEQLLDKYASERKDLLKLSATVSCLVPINSVCSLNTLVTLKSSVGNRQFLLVPEGLGGVRVGDVFLLSESSPLAKQFLNRKIGHTFEFNGISYQVLFIHPNQ